MDIREQIEKWESRLLDLELREEIACQSDPDNAPKARDDVAAVRKHLERLRRLEGRHEA
jgi:hypothetical protein